MTGTRQNALLLGVPTWTSAPIEVAPGETLTLSVDVSSVGLSSAPSIAIVQLGTAGQVLGTVNLLAVPTATTGFTTLTRSVAIPANVTGIRLVLTGFSASDLRTTGTVTFDNVRLE